MTEEKNDILPQTTVLQPSAVRRNPKLKYGMLVGLLGVIGLLHIHRTGKGAGCHFRDVLDGGFDLKKPSAELCPQVGPLTPSKHRTLWEATGKTFDSGAFKSKAVQWLGGAVRVPTESYDLMDAVGVDPRWAVFGPFHDYLLRAYPRIHSNLKLTKVNTYGLIYHWQGSDDSLKPLFLAAHQDVVPVDPRTVDEWEHPPYSGYFDGEFLWGRGSSDDKSGLIGIMSAIETLLKNGFEPTRSVVLAFGFDEEASGIYGAQALSKVLLSTYGENAFAMVVDEGSGFGERYGGVFAVPGVAEKGYLDVRVEVSAPGGHSSIPPAHTSIGMLSSLLVHYEAHPYTVHLERGTPMYGMVQCFAAHAPDLPKSLRHLIKKSVRSDTALRAVEKILFKDNALKSLVGTTQAIDLIQGGVKTNALPEQASAVVNHRIATQSSIDAVKAHDTALLEHLAAQYNLSYSAFGKDVHVGDGPAYGSLVLTDAWGTGLEPAPITPTDADAIPYQLLSGTIKATYNTHRASQSAEEIHVVPGIMSGNTDTRYYWNMTKHIFRYNHQNGGNSGQLPSGVHTVNESISIDAFVEMIRFFTTLILNADESTKL